MYQDMLVAPSFAHTDHVERRRTQPQQSRGISFPLVDAGTSELR